MLMCKPCSAKRRVRKLKQIGKTQKENYVSLRRYRCMGCGATLLLSGDLCKPKHVVESWRLLGVEWPPRADSIHDLLPALVGQIPLAVQVVWR